MSNNKRNRNRRKKKTQAQKKVERQQAQRARHKQWPYRLVEIPESEWPQDGRPAGMIRVLRSRDYIVQEYVVQKGMVHRLSVTRTSYQRIEDRMTDNIPWDELMRLKGEAGYIHACAVEIYPPIKDSVNMDDMRHLWVYIDGATPYFMWKSGKTPPKVAPETPPAESVEIVAPDTSDQETPDADMPPPPPPKSQTQLDEEDPPIGGAPPRPTTAPADQAPARIGGGKLRSRDALEAERNAGHE